MKILKGYWQILNECDSLRLILIKRISICKNNEIDALKIILECNICSFFKILQKRRRNFKISMQIFNKYKLRLQLC